MVSRAYQPSVAASASIAAWSNHQVRWVCRVRRCRYPAGCPPDWARSGRYRPSGCRLFGRCAGGCGRGGGGADGVAQVGAGLAVAGDLLELAVTFSWLGRTGRPGRGPGGPGPLRRGRVSWRGWPRRHRRGRGVHEDAAQPDRRVAFALELRIENGWASSRTCQRPSWPGWWSSCAGRVRRHR